MADKPKKLSDFAANDTFRHTVTTLSRIDRKYDDFSTYYKTLPASYHNFYTQLVGEISRNMKNVEKTQLDLWFWAREAVESLERAERTKESLMKMAKAELERKKQEEKTQADRETK